MIKLNGQASWPSECALRRRRQRAHSANSHKSLPPTPELTATQKAFMGDRTFAKARAAGNNATEAGHACARLAIAGADIALSLPAEYRDLKNDT